MKDIYVEDEKKIVSLSDLDFTKNRIGEKKDYYTLGCNTLEGRKETTVWKSLEEMQKYIATCLATVKKDVLKEVSDVR